MWSLWREKQNKKTFRQNFLFWTILQRKLAENSLCCLCTIFAAPWTRNHSNFPPHFCVFCYEIKKYPVSKHKRIFTLESFLKFNLNYVKTWVENTRGKNFSFHLRFVIYSWSLKFFFSVKIKKGKSRENISERNE